MAYLFLFDLDSTLTKAEILPHIAQAMHLSSQMQELTEQACSGKTPYAASLAQRISLLAALPVDCVQAAVAAVAVSAPLCRFLAQHKERCYIVTSNVDVWIAPLVERLGMQGRCFSSVCRTAHNRLVLPSLQLADKAAVVRQLGVPAVAIGDGENDVPMLQAAAIGFAYGGVRPLGANILAAADRVFYNDTDLCTALTQLSKVP